MLKIQQLHDELVLIIKLFWSAYVYNKTFDQKKYKYLYFEKMQVAGCCSPVASCRLPVVAAARNLPGWTAADVCSWGLGNIKGNWATRGF